MEHTDFSNISDSELKKILKEAYFDNPGEDELKEYVSALTECVLGNDICSDDVAEEITLLFNRHPNNEDVCELMSYYITDRSFSLKEENELLSAESLLASIYDAFPNNTQIACDLASVLTNLISVQNYDAALKTVERVKDLKKSFPKEREINDSCKSAESEIKQKKKTFKYKKAVDAAETNYSNNPNEKTAIALASSLSSLADVEVSESEVETIVSKINKLLNAFPSCDTIWISFANSLASLSNCQNFEAAKETIFQLHALVNFRNSTEEIAEIYAEALSSQTIWNDHDISEYVIELSRLNTQYPSNESIACSYASGLCSLAEAIDVVANKDKRIETIDKLHELTKKYKGDKDIKEYYDDAVNSFKWDEDFNS